MTTESKKLSKTL